MFPEHFARDVGEERQRGKQRWRREEESERRCCKDARWRLNQRWLHLKPSIIISSVFSDRTSSHHSSFLGVSVHACVQIPAFLFVFLCSRAQFALKHEITSLSFFCCPGILSFPLPKAFEIMLLPTPLIHSDQGSHADNCDLVIMVPPVLRVIDLAKIDAEITYC